MHLDLEAVDSIIVTTTEELKLVDDTFVTITCKGHDKVRRSDGRERRWERCLLWSGRPSRLDQEMA